MTITISTVISAFNSLTLSPALSALLLHGHDAPKDWLTRGMNKVFGRLLRAASTGSSIAASDSYRPRRDRRDPPQVGRRARCLRACCWWPRAAVFLAWCPSGFVPAQDKQYLVGFAQLPNGASLDRTEDVIRRM